MEKQELSYSDRSVFNKYIRKALNALIEQDYKEVRNHIYSAKDMVFDWRCDGITNYYDDAWLVHLLYDAIEACEAHDSGTVFELLVRIKSGFKKMVARYDIKQDTDER